MSLKTIIVHVDTTPRASERIDLAAQLAVDHDAHLIGLAPSGWSAQLYAPASFEAALLPPAVDAGPLRDACRTALAGFEAQARAHGVVSIESRLVDEEAGLALAMHGRYSDLVVAGQTRGSGHAGTLRGDVPEYVLLNCTVPLLLVPAVGSFGRVGREVALAWNGSIEAHRAVVSALPLLQRARHVYLIMINPRAAGIDEGDEPGADMALYLARHGIRVEVAVRAAADHADEAILAAVNGCSADLVVMGAYGRSRFRQLLMGGATRTMLESMTVPVWMAH